MLAALMAINPVPRSLRMMGRSRIMPALPSMRFDRTVHLAASWLALAAMLASAALPVLAHGHGLERLQGAGRVQVCAGGEIRWVRVDVDKRAGGTSDTGPAERSSAADPACPVCAASAGHDALPASGSSPAAIVDGCALAVSAPPASALGNGRWLVASARAPPISLLS